MIKDKLILTFTVGIKDLSYLDSKQILLSVGKQAKTTLSAAGFDNDDVVVFVLPDSTIINQIQS